MYPCMSDNIPVPLFHATTVLKAAVKLLLKLLKGNVSRTLPATVHAPQMPTTHAEQNINYQLHSAEISTILSQNLRIFLPELVPNNVTVQGNNFSPSPCHFNFLFFCFLWQFYFLGRDFINLKIESTH